MIHYKQIACGACLCILSWHAKAQADLSAVPLKPMRGAIATYRSFTQKDSLVLIVFWSMQQDESINELNAINTHYETWKQNASFKLMAVSVDTGKLSRRVRSTVIMNGWTFDVYVDVQGRLRSALASGNLPQAFIVSKQQVLYQQSGYQPGTENYLFNKILQFARSP